MSIKLNEEKLSISGTVSIGATVSYMDKNKISPAIILIMGTGKTDTRNSVNTSAEIKLVTRLERIQF